MTETISPLELAGLAARYASICRTSNMSVELPRHRWKAVLTRRPHRHRDAWSRNNECRFAAVRDGFFYRLLHRARDIVYDTEPGVRMDFDRFCEDHFRDGARLPGLLS